jgi:hypothetical protein
MKKLIFIAVIALTSSSALAANCPEGSVETNQGCAILVQPLTPTINGHQVNGDDVRLRDHRCYDDGVYEPYDDDCVRAYPELSKRDGYIRHNHDRYDDDRYEVWDD